MLQFIVFKVLLGFVEVGGVFVANRLLNRNTGHVQFLLCCKRVIRVTNQVRFFHFNLCVFYLILEFLTRIIVLNLLFLRLVLFRCQATF